MNRIPNIEIKRAISRYYLNLWTISDQCKSVNHVHKASQTFQAQIVTHIKIIRGISEPITPPGDIDKCSKVQTNTRIRYFQ